MFGRVNETRLVMDLFLRTNWFRFLSMTGLGMNLMRTGRMSLLPDHIKKRGELRKVLSALDSEEKA
jgi:hypothetical protein